jgi:hypothetical protein
MVRIKKVMAIIVLALVASLGTPQAFGGAVETPGATAPARTGTESTSPGAVELPGIATMLFDYFVSML